MQVILLDKIANLGNVGDQINVKSGYARNYLVPQGKAVPATKDNIEHFQARRAELEAKVAATVKEAEEKAAKIIGLGSIKVASKAGDEGRLFGSIGARDIAIALQNAGITVQKNEIRLPTGVLRALGEHEVAIQLHSEVVAKLTVNVIPE